MNAMTYHKVGSPSDFKALGLDHPTPTHIRCNISRELTAAMARNPGQHVPLFVFEAINEGIRSACREHDEGVL